MLHAHTHTPTPPTPTLPTPQHPHPQPHAHTAGTIVGGTMELNSNCFILACFHGVNFRVKSWAIFSMTRPMAMFSTECMDIINDGRLRLCNH